MLGATLQGGAGLGAAALGGAASAGRSPGMQLGPGGAMGGAMPPLLRACVLLPLRMPSLFTSALLLNLLCVRGLVPATLEEVRGLGIGVGGRGRGRGRGVGGGLVVATLEEVRARDRGIRGLEG